MTPTARNFWYDVWYRLARTEEALDEEMTQEDFQKEIVRRIGMRPDAEHALTVSVDQDTGRALLDSARWTPVRELSKATTKLSIRKVRSGSQSQVPAPSTQPAAPPSTPAVQPPAPPKAPSSDLGSRMRTMMELVYPDFPEIERLPQTVQGFTETLLPIAHQIVEKEREIALDLVDQRFLSGDASVLRPSDAILAQRRALYSAFCAVLESVFRLRDRWDAPHSRPLVAPPPVPVVAAIQPGPAPEASEDVSSEDEEPELPTEVEEALSEAPEDILPIVHAQERPPYTRPALVGAPPPEEVETAPAQLMPYPFVIDLLRQSNKSVLFVGGTPRGQQVEHDEILAGMLGIDPSRLERIYIGSLKKIPADLTHRYAVVFIIERWLSHKEEAAVREGLKRAGGLYVYAGNGSATKLRESCRTLNRMIYDRTGNDPETWVRLVKIAAEFRPLKFAHGQVSSRDAEEIAPDMGMRVPLDFAAKQNLVTALTTVGTEMGLIRRGLRAV